MKSTLKLSCPRCLNKDVRSQSKKTRGLSTTTCRVCGYKGQWREFIEGHAQRKAVQEKFAHGDFSSDLRDYDYDKE